MELLYIYVCNNVEEVEDESASVDLDVMNIELSPVSHTSEGTCSDLVDGFTVKTLYPHQPDGKCTTRSKLQGK